MSDDWDMHRLDVLRATDQVRDVARDLGQIANALTHQADAIVQLASSVTRLADIVDRMEDGMRVVRLQLADIHARFDTLSCGGRGGDCPDNDETPPIPTIIGMGNLKP